ncbi:hypothetical protein CK203_036886 [Vitis vinifera]|uniref:Ubiquitin-like protease family profile domain-containing protein n=1 Tax=Vitis vinifera TaxID=29760 RepID=A0A438GXT3_VITVI|nr:hypothetical protein CK203_036886 [Vitis vinifera]
MRGHYLVCKELWRTGYPNTKIKESKGRVAVEAYSLVGFPYAFQIWAYEAIPLIGLKYALLTFHSLLKPTLEEQQQDYYKHVDKQGASAEMLHQSNASQDAKKDDLRHEKSSSDTAAYVVAATAAMLEETTNDAVAPSIEVKSSNEEHGMHDTRFKKSSTKENDNNVGFDFQTGIFEDVTDDEVERNDIPMDVNIDMEASRNLQLAEKHMTKELKDDYSIDDPVIDIAKLFGIPTISSEFSHIDVAFFFFQKRQIENPHLFPQKFTTVDTMFWQNAQARWIKHGKKWNQFKLPENDILIDYANGLQSLYSVKWPDVDIVYVPINVREWEIERLQDIPQQENDGDCGMFVIKYVEYLMHNHPLKSLTSARMDWFREKMAAELFYMKYLPM